MCEKFSTSSISLLDDTRRVINLWHVCLPAYDEFYRYIVDEVDRLDIPMPYTSAHWQREIPELVKALVEYHLMNIRPHGAVNMIEARFIVRSILPPSPLRYVDALIKKTHWHTRNELGIEADGYDVHCNFARFPLIDCFVHPTPWWNADLGDTDDAENGMRSHTDLSLSADALTTEKRYCWFEFKP